MEDLDYNDEPGKFPWTCPPDARYPNQNATKWCFMTFVDYQKCSRLLGKGNKRCKFFKNCYSSICPSFWIEKWESQIEEGIFPVLLPRFGDEPEEEKDKDKEKSKKK